MESSAVLWTGASQLDGSPIVAIVTGLVRASENDKTGPMAQVWILRADQDPVTAAHRTGADSSVCGDCPLRPSLAAKGAAMCYVRKDTAPLGVYRRFRIGKTPGVAPGVIGEYLVSINRPVRLGAYGDPAAVPADVWHELLQPGVQWTGYTHQWRNPVARELRSIVMASVETPAGRREAKRAGWRTFRVRGKDEPLLAGEIACPASSEAGKRTTCAKCRLCNGRRRGDRRKDEAIIDHGPTAQRKG
jgi:hypothetical protein